MENIEMISTIDDLLVCILIKTDPFLPESRGLYHSKELCFHCNEEIWMCNNDLFKEAKHLKKICTQCAVLYLKIYNFDFVNVKKQIYPEK